MKNIYSVKMLSISGKDKASSFWDFFYDSFSCNSKEENQARINAELDTIKAEIVAKSVNPKTERELAEQAGEIYRDRRISQIADYYHSLPNATGDEPYAVKKQMIYLRGIKQVMSKNNELCLVMPICDEKGNFISLEVISLDKKRFMTGGRTKGGFFILGEDEAIKNPDVIFISEGLATAEAVYQLFDRANEDKKAIFIVATSGGNLEAVANAMDKKYPFVKEKIITADNDASKPIEENIGLKYAKEVADKTNFKKVITPTATEQGKNIDWSDAFLSNRGEAVRDFWHQVDSKPFYEGQQDTSKTVNRNSDKILEPYFQIRETGIFYIALNKRETGYAKPQKIAGYFEVLGKGKDNNGKEYFVFQGKNQRRAIIPRGQLGKNEHWERVREFADIPSAKRKLDLLTDFVQAEIERIYNLNPDAEIWTITDFTGWIANNRAYILPNGEIITLEGIADPETGDIIREEPPKIIFYNDVQQSLISAYQPKGDFQDYIDQVIKHIRGNSRLTLALASALAPVLFPAFNLKGGGFHLYGDSSTGKTLILRVANSVWAAEKAILSWNATPLAITLNGQARNHNLMCCDEISADKSKSNNSIDAIYSVCNGTPRAKGKKDGGLENHRPFTTLLLSTGERSLPEHCAEKGLKIKAGELVRMPSIPMTLETTHSFHSSKDFVKYLEYAVNDNYGLLGVKFIKAILGQGVQDIFTKANKYFEEYRQQLGSNLNSQNSRTADLFATLQATLSILVDMQLFGDDLSIYPSPLDIKPCFEDWLEETLSEAEGRSYEEAQTVKNLTAFMFSNQDNFEDLKNPSVYKPKIIGYWERQKGDIRGEKPKIYYLPQSILETALNCPNLNKRTIDYLASIGWLIKANKGNKCQICYKGERLWAYKFIGLTPPQPELESLDNED